MKNLYALLFLMALSLQGYAQINFEKGYYVNNANQRIDGFIENRDWRNNPNSIEFKSSLDNASIQTLTPDVVKAFNIDNKVKYIGTEVDIDRSSSIASKLDYRKDPVFQKETLFLKILIERDANLYEYREGNLLRYFYKTSDSSIKQLVYKPYESNPNIVSINNAYKKQIWNNLKCSHIPKDKIENLDYNQKDLTDYFILYNNCNQSGNVDFATETKKGEFNLTVRPRVNISSMDFKPGTGKSGESKIDSHLSFGLGVELEYIFPFNRNKWALFMDPNYQSFKADSEDSEGNTAYNTSKADYSSIEVPIGVRHYLFLNEDSKFFADASINLDFALDSKLTYRSGLELPIEYNTLVTNFGFGVGYKYVDKYSVELKYQSGRDVLGEYISWNSNYKTISVILGYSIF
ncbi:outer membrane beta-barrel protein [Flavobacteriaceae bacterium Ap0902]|nr:outer membrane beta-barrel protein [Flavobacteriaceae bacterium Ap0902]